MVAGDCCAGLAGLAGVAKCGDARLDVGRALLSGDERLGRGGARALRGVRGRLRGGVFGLGGAAAASSELWLCMTASSSSSSTCRHLSKMEGMFDLCVVTASSGTTAQLRPHRRGAAGQSKYTLPDLQSLRLRPSARGPRARSRTPLDLRTTVGSTKGLV